jgi:hypothetical protein
MKAKNLDVIHGRPEAAGREARLDATLHHHAADDRIVALLWVRGGI